MGARAQGERFEDTLLELLTRLLRDDLELELTEADDQAPGAQFGKDLRLRWKDARGRTVFWHIECKSHATGSLPAREVADKLLDVHRSAHDIDVWCLALAEIEPSPGLDEMLAWARKSLNLPFALEVLSPKRQFVRRLYACHSDLHERQYGTPAGLDPSERQAVIDGFRSFVDEATERGRESARRDSPWSLVSPSAVQVGSDSTDRAGRYLRGLTWSPDWDAVVHGWAIERRSALDPICERIRGARTGLDFMWLLGAAGEGKSTVMRQVALEIAADQEWAVLWTDRRRWTGERELPLQFLRAVSPDKKILLCVDESESVTNGVQLRAMADRIADESGTVFVLTADRGVRWQKTELLRELQRGLPSGSRTFSLGRLSSGELSALVAVLDARGLIHRDTGHARRVLDEAQATAGDNTAWLLPTLMQLTDPKDRGFESILDDVLRTLTHDPDATRLLLAGSLAHAAGEPLELELGRRLVSAGPSLERALAALQGELAKELGLVSDDDVGERAAHRLITNHAVLADGFVRVADASDQRRPSLVETCRELPAAIGPDISDEHLIPNNRFRLLERCEKYLVSSELASFEAVCAFFESWCALHPSQFPAHHRFGDCLTARLRHEQRGGRVDDAALSARRKQAEDQYRQSLSVARRVLAPGSYVPRPLRKFSLAESERVTFHAWGVLEDTYGQHRGDLDALRRAVLLSLLSLQPAGGDPCRSLVTLATALGHMGESTNAARVTAALLDFDPDNQFGKIWEKRLSELRHVSLPEGGVKLLGKAVAAVCTGFALDRWETIAIYQTRDRHVEALIGILRRTLTWVPESEQLPAAIRRLSEEQADLDLMSEPTQGNRPPIGGCL